MMTLEQLIRGNGILAGAESEQLEIPAGCPMVVPAHLEEAMMYRIMKLSPAGEMIDGMVRKLLDGDIEPRH